MSSKNEKKVINFVTGAKKDFSARILRDTVKDIDISEIAPIAEDESKYKVVGSAMALSPTGKNKSYRYEAEVDVKDGDCSFASVKIELLE